MEPITIPWGTESLSMEVSISLTMPYLLPLLLLISNHTLQPSTISTQVLALVEIRTSLWNQWLHLATIVGVRKEAQPLDWIMCIPVGNWLQRWLGMRNLFERRMSLLRTMREYKLITIILWKNVAAPEAVQREKTIQQLLLWRKEMEK